MNTETTPERMNRTRVEWLLFLTPHEYALLDKMLFQSYLTYANGGQGWKFHVRTLARETRLAVGTISQICKAWPFVKKSGRTTAMTIQLDYPDFEAWIAHRMNNHCSSREPRSSTENGTLPDGTVHPVNNRKANENEPSEARIEPSEAQAIPVLDSAASTEGSNPIVHPVNNKKSTRYVTFDAESIPLRMPYKIKTAPSAARQGEILRQLNDYGFTFVKDTAMETERDGFKFCAVDDSKKLILITAVDKNYLNNPKVQALCQHFEELEYKAMLWTERDQSLFCVVKEEVAPSGSGNSDTFGIPKPDNVPVSVTAAPIQPSASGNTKVLAPENNTGHPVPSANPPEPPTSKEIGPCN